MSRPLPPLLRPLPDSTWPTWVPEARQWATHGIMAALNTRVVRRSAALWAGAGRPYAAAGTPFAHGEYAVVRTWFAALLTKVVGRGDPFQRTSEPLTKLLPFTVSVKSPPPGGV